MNVTAVGSGARVACKAWLPAAIPANPGGDLQCSYEREGLTITVRDKGHAYYGGNYCTHLVEWWVSGGPIPDVDSGSYLPVIPSQTPS
jgi:hypothetical protein